MISFKPNAIQESYKSAVLSFFKKDDVANVGMKR